MASPRKSERLISSRGHGCFTISPPQLPATATRFPSHGSGRPGLVLRRATKLSSVGFEPKAVLTFGLRVRRLNHSVTHSASCRMKTAVQAVATLAKQYSAHVEIIRYNRLSSDFDTQFLKYPCLSLQCYISLQECQRSW